MRFLGVIIALFWCAVNWSQEYRVIETFHLEDTSHRLFVSTDELIEERWDILAQPNFWREVMNLPPDSCIINIAATREILGKDSFVEWKKTNRRRKIIV